MRCLWVVGVQTSNHNHNRDVVVSLSLSSTHEFELAQYFLWLCASLTVFSLT